MSDRSELGPSGGLESSEGPSSPGLAAYHDCRERLRAAPGRWLVTGAAGFIGSHLVETLLGLGQGVVGLDNFSTGHRRNLDEVRRSVGSEAWRNFQLFEGNVADPSACREAMEGVDYVLHQAALASVPLSLADPVAADSANVRGFLNVLQAARGTCVRRVVYASSSAVYGDDPAPSKTEACVGHPLSPYAVTKAVNELYAGVFSRAFGVSAAGLRYFNVFGPRQDPAGAYAAVIPRWILALLRGQEPVVYGDGENSRDFCHVSDVVQANLLAATSSRVAGPEVVFNVGGGRRTTLKQLHSLLVAVHRKMVPGASGGELRYEPARPGDIRDSLADLSRTRRVLGYEPLCPLEEALGETLAWYRQQAAAEQVPNFGSPTKSGLLGKV